MFVFCTIWVPTCLLACICICRKTRRVNILFVKCIDICGTISTSEPHLSGRRRDSKWPITTRRDGERDFSHTSISTTEFFTFTNKRAFTWFFYRHLFGINRPPNFDWKPNNCLSVPHTTLVTNLSHFLFLAISTGWPTGDPLSQKWHFVPFKNYCQ